MKNNPQRRHRADGGGGTVPVDINNDGGKDLLLGTQCGERIFNRNQAVASSTAESGIPALSRLIQNYPSLSIASATTT